jgi:hypothetical protein
MQHRQRFSYPQDHRDADSRMPLVGGVFPAQCLLSRRYKPNSCREVPTEQAAEPDHMVPFVPILEKGQVPFAMFVDLQSKDDWVLDVIVYPS